MLLIVCEYCIKYIILNIYIKYSSMIIYLYRKLVDLYGCMDVYECIWFNFLFIYENYVSIVYYEENFAYFIKLLLNILSI